jgi:hypothetical protein
MRQIHDQQYAEFTPKERVQLVFAALARNDETEATRLWGTCPRHTFVTTDLNFTEQITALNLLSAMFFEKCVRHYNLIKKADMFIMCSEQDLEFEDREGFEDFANQTRKLIELAGRARNGHISQLKGLYEGFKQFCSDVGFDSENILKITSVKDCCYDLDILLDSDIEVDIEYSNQIKDLLLEHWHF